MICNYICLFLSQAVGASVRIFELLDRAPALTPGTVRLPDAKGKIAFLLIFLHQFMKHK